jgi:hypothetical protein
MFDGCNKRKEQRDAIDRFSLELKDVRTLTSEEMQPILDKIIFFADGTSKRLGDMGPEDFFREKANG